MSEKDENRAMIAWLETAKTAIEKAQWNIVDIECKKERAEALANAIAVMDVGISAIGYARRTALAIAEETMGGSVSADRTQRSATG